MRSRNPRQAGFTLVELMITCVIIAILAAIAIPSYNSSVRKSRRTEARNALLDLAGREERYMATNNQYSTDPSALGYSGFPAATTGGYYNLQTPTVTAGGLGAAPSFSVTAEAAGPQVADTDCRTFIVDSTGAQSSKNSAGVLSTDPSTCWK